MTHPGLECRGHLWAPRKMGSTHSSQISSAQNCVGRTWKYHARTGAHLLEIISKLVPNRSQIIITWNQSHPNVYFKVAAKRRQNNFNLTHNYTKVIPNGTQHDAIRKPIWRKLTPMWFQTDPLAMPEWLPKHLLIFLVGWCLFLIAGRSDE